MDGAYRLDELAAIYGNFSLQGRTFETGKAMRLSVLPAHARSSSYDIANTYRGSSDFCRRKSLARREDTVSNTLKKGELMGSLIAVPAAGTACLESFGWTSIDHIEVDAKVWPGIVAMEIGMAGRHKMGTDERKRRRGADTEKEVLLWRSRKASNFSMIYFCPYGKSIHSSLYGRPGTSKGTPKRFVDPNSRKVPRET